VSRSATTTEQPIPLVLRLLDHQIVGDAKEMLGNVDDLQLVERGGHLIVRALMSGPPALARRQGGRGGRWLDATWRRLHREEEPRPLALPMDHVVQLRSAVEVDEVGERALAEAQGLELWVRAHIVGRLPGALGGEHDLPGEPSAAGSARKLVAPRDALTLSQLLGATVRSGTRELGRVMEVTADVVDPSADRLGELRVRDLVCSPHHLGEELGYTMARQGPAAVGWLLRLWHRGDLRVSMADVVAVDWDSGTVEVREGAELRHPHEPVGSHH
jgi:hypothetical protein